MITAWVRPRAISLRTASSRSVGAACRSAAREGVAVLELADERAPLEQAHLHLTADRAPFPG